MRIALVAALAAATIPIATFAHDFLILHDEDTGGEDTLAIRLLMTEDHMKAERTPPLDAVTLDLVTAEGRTPVSLHEGEAWLAGTVREPVTAHILAAQMIRDRERPHPNRVAGEVCATRSADFAKAFGDDDGDLWSRPVGQRLEVVPLSDPDDLDPGDTLRVRVLFDGEPVSTRVQATYDGHGGGFPIRLESDDEGYVDIALDRPGLWLVRAKHNVEEERPTHRCYEGAANIVVEVGRD